MLNSKCGIIGEAPHENLHIIRHYAKLQLIDFMANITLKDITPIHFLNTDYSRLTIIGFTVR